MQNANDVQPVDLVAEFEGAPIPLVPRVLHRPFPVDALPTPYDVMVEAVAEATQTDPAMPAVSVLSVLAAAAGGCAEVEVRPGWREPLCLFTATIAAPGERKSAVQASLTAPIVEAETELAASSSAERTEATTLKKIAALDAERAQRAASSADDGEKDRAKADAISAAMLSDAIAVAPITRLIADDVTPEAAASLMAEQHRLAIVSAEGGIFDIIAGRYSNNVPSMDLWLKGHAGDRLRVDRKGRDPEYVKRPALTLGLMVQPNVIDTIGRISHFRGRGLLARFLYAQPRSNFGRRRAGAAPVPPAVGESYASAVRDLVMDLAGWAGDPVMIVLTPEAHGDVIAIEEATERELADGGALHGLRDWGSKYAGAVLRIAGLLHLAEHGAAGVRRPIERSTILSAVRIGGYFKAHAVEVFASMGTDESTTDAIFVLDRILRTERDRISERDIHREARSRFGTVAELRPVIANLTDRGFLAPMPEPESKGGPGRKPSPVYAVHPDAPKYGTDWTERTQQAESAGSVHSVQSVPNSERAAS